MEKSYSNLLKQNKIQLNYIKSLFERRGKVTDRVLNCVVSEHLKGTEMEETLVDLFFHAIQPIYRTSRILENPALNWDDEQYERTAEQYKGDQLLDIYNEILSYAESQYENIDPNNLKGELSEVNGNEENLVFRLAVVGFHATHHISQIIRLHGMLCRLFDKD